MDKIILMYHDTYVHEPFESGFHTNGANVYKLKFIDFENQIKLIDYYCNKGILSRDTLRLTFDDSGVSNYTHIAPILDKYNFKGYFFIVTDYIGSDGFMSENQIIDLKKRGHFIGSHTCSHPANINILSTNERERQWKNSIYILNKLLNSPIDIVSIPNGYYNKNDLDLFCRLGIKTVFTSSICEDYIYKNLHVIGRVGITNAMSIKRIGKILSDKRTILKMIRRQRRLDLLKRLLGTKYNTIKKIIRDIQRH